ncbi:hypothetical protein WJ0W_006590 [Paenibacillus melissococcoides]|uniref:Uncharacterized protein n=1 Tax=Paenibacillus melissococcoides TaxID=2912268 RepID=A0ABM9GBQ6_9BACL|nr:MULTISPECIES: hypothetical protein [Paenibacillus]MEB9896408.1 hypothetical protein [Bacillus cereus]CAH8249405.1 hypothetical protein WJ0W_006590 [Paenibacillus melissococcoides]CAH8721508.1 hypothetical protein HTL2_006395 [Paenibacillus melissococcoides]
MACSPGLACSGTLLGGQGALQQFAGLPMAQLFEAVRRTVAGYRTAGSARESHAAEERPQAAGSSFGIRGHIYK